MLAAVFHFKLLEGSSAPVLKDLIRSFKVEAPPCLVRPPAWDLTVVLLFLNSSTFEPLPHCSLWNLTKMMLFLVSLATAKRVGELQAVSWCVSFVGPNACLSYVPEFVARTESSSNPLPRSFLVKSLADFAAGLEDELLLCPVRALRVYLRRTGFLSPPPRRLFVSPRFLSRSISKNGISFSMREVIHESGASRVDGGPVRAHSVRSVSTSAAFHRNWSVSRVLGAATWKTNPVFAAFYFWDLQYEFENIRSLGLFVAAGERISLLSPLLA